MPTKPKTWKTIADQRRKENFVGRAEQLKVFTDNFTSDEPTWMVLSITGEGGVGKSTLLKRYTQLAESPEINANAVICDDHHYTPVDAMAAIAEQLDKLGIESKNFNERHKKYRETLQQIESDPSAPRGMVNVVTRGLTDFAVKSLRRTPGIGVAMDYVDEKAAGDALAELAQYTLTRWGNKDETKLVREPEKILTPLFVELLNEAAEKKHLEIMFDVFERTAATLSSWLIALFNSDYGEIDFRVSFILSGRDALEQHWTELAGLMTHVQLEPFTPEETAIYLSNQGIIDETLVRQIHQDTGGLPVLVEFLAGANPQPGHPLPDISERAVERFLWWTKDVDKRRVGLMAAVPRQFNKDILSTLLNQDATHLFNWLISQSYIRSNTERGWFYHEKVRELMLRYQRNTAPGGLSENHTRLAEQFTELQAKMEMQAKDAYESETWRRLELERVFHLLSAMPEKNWSQIIYAFLPAFFYRWRFAEQISHVVQIVLSETGCTTLEKDLANLCELLTAYDKDDYQQVIHHLNALQNIELLNPLVLKVFLSKRGDAFSWLKKYEDAIVNFDRAIELDGDLAWTIACRGDAYRLMGKFSEAITDFDRAIKLDDKLDWAFASRGLAYYSTGNYAEALIDFNHAIELDAKFALAFACRGLVYRVTDKYTEAIENFTCAIELDDKLAWAIVNRGEMYKSKREYEEAIADFTRVIDLDNNYAWAVASRAEIYRLVENYEEAIKDFNRAIELDKKNASIFASRGETYRLMGGKNTEALADFTHAIELDDKYTWALASRGEINRLVSNYEEAIKDFSRAIELDEKNASIFASRGETYRLMGNRDADAVVDFTRAIELDAKYAWPIASRGETYRHMGKHEEALQDFNRAIELDNNDAWVFASRGETYRSMNDRNIDALADFTRAIELDEKNFRAISRRGEIYRLNKQYDEALADLNHATELEANDTFALSSRGECYRQKGQYNEAFKDFDRVVELGGESVWIYSRRGETYRLKNQYDEALVDLTHAIELEANDTFALSSRGECYRQKGQYNDALADLDHVIELVPNSAFTLATRGRTYRAMGRYPEALMDFDSAIALDKNNASMIASRGETYRLMGKYAEALLDFNRAIELDSNIFYSYYARGDIHRRLKEFDKALADLTFVIEQGEPDSNDFATRAAIYLTLGNQETAQQDLDKALSDELKDGHYGRAQALIIKNQIPESLTELEIAFQDAGKRQRILTDDLLDPLRGLPEYQALLAKYG